MESTECEGKYYFSLLSLSHFVLPAKNSKNNRLFGRLICSACMFLSFAIREALFLDAKYVSAIRRKHSRVTKLGNMRTLLMFPRELFFSLRARHVFFHHVEKERVMNPESGLRGRIINRDYEMRLAKALTPVGNKT